MLVTSDFRLNDDSRKQKEETISVKHSSKKPANERKNVFRDLVFNKRFFSRERKFAIWWEEIKMA